MAFTSPGDVGPILDRGAGLVAVERFEELRGVDRRAAVDEIAYYYSRDLCVVLAGRCRAMTRASDAHRWADQLDDLLARIAPRSPASSRAGGRAPISKGCWRRSSAITAGTWRKRPVTPHQTACRIFFRACTGMLMRCAMTCGPMRLSISVTLRPCWCSMRPAFSRKAISP